MYACTYACVKLLAYSLLFWLPMYLSESYRLDNEVVGSMASILEVGSVVGALVIGYVTDKLGVRSPVIVPLLAVSVPLLLLVRTIPESRYWMLYIVIFLIGFCIVGCNHMISSAIAADLATNTCLQGNEETLSTVAGIIDGSGGFGAAIGQVSVRPRQIGSLANVSWEAVFILLIGNCKPVVNLLAVVLLLPTVHRDLKKLKSTPVIYSISVE